MAQLTPPSPLSGARRPANLAKYLERRGHRVTVLTSLASGSGGIPGATRVVRTRDLLASRLNWRRGHFEAIQGQQQATASASSPLELIVAARSGARRLDAVRRPPGDRRSRGAIASTA